MGSTDFRVLGPLEIETDGTRIEIGAPKERALLLLFLLAGGRVILADRIVEELWDGAPPSSAPKLVQQYVSHLRGKLGREVIETVPSGYRAAIDPASLDAVRFEELADAGRTAQVAGNAQLAVAQLSRALALWRGPALADVAYHDFALGEAARLEELRLDCEEDRLAARLTLGEDEVVLADSARLSAEHPHRERLRGVYMIALYRAGRQVEALEVFREARKSLLEELGLEPGDDLRAVEAAILRQDPALSRAEVAEHEATTLPTAVTTLIGRERELADLRALVLREDVRLVSLVGAGGSGKSRLALALAGESRTFFANGVAWVELAGLRDAALVLPTLAQALGVGEDPGGTVDETLAAWAAGRELLVVLDNFEQVTEAGPELLRLIEAAPRLTVVVTSRRVLHLSGEHVFPVDPLGEAAAADLFVQRARALDPRSLSAADDPDVAEICRRLDGLPLAIELAASRTSMLSPRQLLDRLGARLTLLTGGPHDLPARQQTLRDTLDWSAALLSPAERTLLGRLAVFPSDISLDAAVEVAGGDLDTLGGLVANSMLQRDPAAETTARFRMLETVREYALELLGPARQQAVAAHTAYYLSLAEEAQLRGPEQVRWLDLLAAEQDNLRAALDDAHRAPDPEPELRLVVALWRFWWLRGHLAEARSRLEQALARSQEVAPRLRADALRGAAGIAWSQGDLARANALATLGCEVSAASGDADIGLGCYTVLGLIARDEHDYDLARQHLEQSAAMARSLGRDVDELVAKMNLGSVAFESGDHAAAVPLWLDVLDHHRAAGNVEGQGIAQLNLGIAAYRLGDTGDARRCFAEAEELFAAIGFREHLAHALQGLAAIEAADERDVEAAALLGRAAALLGETGSGTGNFDDELAREVEEALRLRLGDQEFDAAFARP